MKRTPAEETSHSLISTHLFPSQNASIALQLAPKITEAFVSPPPCDSYELCLWLWVLGKTSAVFLSSEIRDVWCHRVYLPDEAAAQTLRNYFSAEYSQIEEG